MNNSTEAVDSLKKKLSLCGKQYTASFIWKSLPAILLDNAMGCLASLTAID